MWVFCFQSKTYFISLQTCLLMKGMAILTPGSIFQELKKTLTFIKMSSDISFMLVLVN